LLLNLLKEPTNGPDFFGNQLMMGTNRVLLTRTQRRRSRWRALWILCFAVASIPLAVVMEGLTGYSSPGVIIQSYLLPSRGHDDMTRFLILSIALDSAFCFALVLGLYLLCTKLSNGRKNDPS